MSNRTKRGLTLLGLAILAVGIFVYQCKSTTTHDAQPAVHLYKAPSANMGAVEGNERLIWAVPCKDLVYASSLSMAAGYKDVNGKDAVYFEIINGQLHIYTPGAKEGNTIDNYKPPPDGP